MVLIMALSIPALCVSERKGSKEITEEKLEVPGQTCKPSGSKEVEAAGPGRAVRDVLQENGTVFVR